MKFLIIGFGSIGKRHAVNLAELGVNISVVEPNQVKMNQAIQLGFKVYKSLEEFESKVDYEITAVIICTPPVLHIHHTKWAVNQNKKVFLEKPIGMNYEECSSLVSDSFKNLFVGYSYRWNPQILELKNILEQDKIGNPYFANFTIGMNLEDWHPWEDYSDFFMSDKNKGGGALLDESHFIELIIELFGIPDYIFGIQKKISNLRITSDDYVNAKLQYRDLIVDLNLDLFKRPHESTIKIYGPRGSLICDLIKKTNLLTVYQEYAKFHEDYKIFTYDRNQVFQEMIRDFLIFVKSSTIKPKVPFSRGLQVMFLIDRIRESSATGSWVKVNGN